MVIRATSAEFNEAKPANDDDVMALWAPTAGFADEVTPCVALESHWMFGADTTVNVSFCGSYADDVSSAGVCSCFACMTGSAKELAFIDPEAGRAGTAAIGLPVACDVAEIAFASACLAMTKEMEREVVRTGALPARTEV